jgi:ribonuclease Z
MMLARTTSLAIGGKGERNTLVGRSRAGEGTCFALPELKWMFDCGALIQGWKPRIIFLTHTHSDHAHFLTHIKNEINPPVIYLPAEAEPFVKAHLIAHQEMTECMKEAESQEGGKYHVDYILRPTRPGEEIRFRQGGTEYVVRTLRMEHRIPCLGYSIFKMRSQLKDEYIGMPGREIGRLRKEGVDVTVSYEEPLICFLGDTTAAVFSHHPEILSQHKVIVVECSFIDTESLPRAEKTKHMHWNSLKPHVEAHPDTFFVLTHFSLKYSALSLRYFFQEQQKRYGNIHPMLVDDEVIEQWKPSEGSGTSPPRCNCSICR